MFNSNNILLFILASSNYKYFCKGSEYNESESTKEEYLSNYLINLYKKNIHNNGLFTKIIIITNKYIHLICDYFFKK